MKLRTIEEAEVRGHKVLLRADFNVPLSEGEVADDFRIRAALPTIRWLLERGAKVAACSHLGRPKGEVVPELSLAPVARRLGELLGREVPLLPDCVGAEVEKAVGGLPHGGILLLENVRFHLEEEANDPEFARELAAPFDLYVNDAFGTAHRAHASTEGVTRFIKPAAAGYLMQKEIDYLENALAEPKRPFVAIIGGAKISGKIEVIKNLLKKVDTLLIGGGMIFTFYKAMGLTIGKSLLEEDKIGEAESLLSTKFPDGVELLLPDDILAADKLEKPFKTEVVDKTGIEDGWIGVDIGPATRKRYAGIITAAKTVVWNGPMGIFEIDEFAGGTLAVAQAMAEATAKGAVTIVGGGDSAAALKKLGLKDKITHVSTGGGASLEFLEGKTLPGLAALTEKE